MGQPPRLLLDGLQPQRGHVLADVLSIGHRTRLVRLRGDEVFRRLRLLRGVRLIGHAVRPVDQLGQVLYLLGSTMGNSCPS